MTRSPLLAVSLALFAVLPGTPAHGQSGATVYTDSRGRTVEFLLGDASFADEVVTFENGGPPATESKWSDPKLVLGPPNYVARNAASLPPAAVTLGCAGVLTVRFTDNALVDVPGPDLSGRVIAARGFGATRPVASNADDAGRQKNRRVHIIVDPRCKCVRVAAAVLRLASCVHAGRSFDAAWADQEVRSSRWSPPRSRP